MKLDYSKPILCAQCGKKDYHHRAIDRNCPFGSPRNSRHWPSNFYPNQVFIPKVSKKKLTKISK